MIDRPKIFVIILTVVVYIISSGVSYALFSNTINSGNKLITTSNSISRESKDGPLKFDESTPKTEECPLNGVYYSKPQRQWWETHRPLGIMIENHEDARPQSGISSADVVYEAVAEGGITRFLAIFYCQDAGIVGPVRSARTYFLDFISEYGENPLYTHVGGANASGPADALSQIGDYGWASYNDMNQFSIGFPTFLRDYNRLGKDVATEHTMYSTTTKLWDFAKTKRGLTNVDEEGNSWDEKFVKYTFKDEATLTQRGDILSIHLEPWTDYKQYAVDWNYDRNENLYSRNNGGVPHLDKNTNKILTTKNIVLLFMQESNANDGYENNLHLLYKTKGSGKAIVLQDGEKIEGRWKKESRTARMQILDKNGSAVTFNKGIIWFTVLPIDAVVNIK